MLLLARATRLEPRPRAPRRGLGKGAGAGGMARASFAGALRWAFVMNWGQQGAQSLITLVLAAILGPEAFGLAAMALVYLAFFQLFLGLGLSGALIHRPDLSSLHLDTAFWMVVASTVAVLLASTLGAGPWAAFNRRPDLAPVILGLAPSLVFRGLAIVHQAHLQKQMDFRRLAIRSNLSALLGGAIGLAMAFEGFGVWALVAQQLATTFIETTLLWILSGWRPRPRFSRELARQLLDFSSRVLLSRLGVFAQRRSDAVILGYFFGPVALALYRMAERLMQLVIELATRPVAVVALPNFARLQSDPAALRAAGLTTLKTSSIFGIPALAGLAAVSPFLMDLLGEEWNAAAPVLQILCVLGAARTLTLFTGSLLQAVGRPGLLAAMQWSLAAANIVAFTTIGFWLREREVLEQISGIALARTGIFALLFAPPSLYLLLRFSGNRVGDLLRAVAPSLLGALSVALGAAAAQQLVAGGSFSAAAELALQVAAGATAGVAVLYLIDADFRRQLESPLAYLRGGRRG